MTFRERHIGRAGRCEHLTLIGLEATREAANLQDHAMARPSTTRDRRVSRGELLPHPPGGVIPLESLGQLTRRDSYSDGM